MLAGLIRDDERRVLDGIPGLSDIPVVGRVFAHSRTATDQTDIILTLTPRIVRVLNLTEEDLAAFRVGRDSGAPADVPILPVPLPTPPPRPPGGDANDIVTPGRAPFVPPSTGPAAPIKTPAPRPPGAQGGE